MQRQQTSQVILTPQAPSAGIAWFRLLDTLNPGDTAPANELYWDAGNNRPGYIDDRVYIYDRWYSAAQDDDTHAQYGRNFGLKGEIFQCAQFPGTEDWCCLGSQGLLRQGGVASTISADSYGDVEIYVGDPSDYLSPFGNDVGEIAVDEGGSSVTVRAYYHWITVQSSVETDVPVTVYYFADRFRWEIIDHGCDNTTIVIPT